MPFRRSGPTVTTVRDIVQVDEQPVAPQDMRALVAAAAAIALDEGSVMRRRVTALEWQREAWRQYDINGELRFAANRHAGALSQCQIYVAELDDEGNPGALATDPDVAQLAQGIFGGPAKRAEYLRAIDVQLYVGGESYVIAESAAKKDKDIWYVVTTRQIRKEGGSYKVRRPEEHGGGWHTIDPKADLMTRVWTPHPEDFDLADSSVRSVLPVLREIERLTLLTFSQIDSRLISAGLLLLPQGITFPRKPNDDGTVTPINSGSGLSGLLEMIMEVASAQLTGAGTAAGLIPILAEIPRDTGKDIQHIKFETALTAEIKDKLDHAIRRLATGLDIDPQELLGMGDSNHWSAWQIDENGIKLFIQPVMTRICDALTQTYLAPALKLLGKDPDKYTLWFDPSPLTTRPNRFEDALQLWDRGVLTDEELRGAGNFSDDDEPKAEELSARRAWELVKLDPKLLSNAQIAKLVGLPQVEDAAPALPPGQSDQTDQLQQLLSDTADTTGTDQRSLPQEPTSTETPAQKGGRKAFATLLPGAEQVVLRALELAGGRMLDRHSRGRYTDVDRFDLHTHIDVGNRDRAQTLLAGAFNHVPALARHHGVEAGQLEYLLREYCTELLVRGYAHSPELLREMLRRAHA